MIASKCRGDAEAPEHGAFLFLMSLHAGEDVIERADGFRNVWALVQHDAFGALGHGGIGDFGTRGYAFFGENIEYLRGPYDG